MPQLIAIFLALGFGNPTPVQAQEITNYVVEYTPDTAPDIIRAYAAHYGTPAKPLLDTLTCESSLNEYTWNKKDPHGGSKGVAQFQTSTFRKYAPRAGVENPDIWNPFNNIQVAAYMFSIGEQHQWTCYNKLYGNN